MAALHHADSVALVPVGWFTPETSRERLRSPPDEPVSANGSVPRVDGAKPSSADPQGSWWHGDVVLAVMRDGEGALIGYLTLANCRRWFWRYSGLTHLSDLIDGTAAYWRDLHIGLLLRFPLRAIGPILVATRIDHLIAMLALAVGWVRLLFSRSRKGGTTGESRAPRSEPAGAGPR